MTKLRTWPGVIGQWFEQRLRRPEYDGTYRVPRSSVSWAYVFGSAAFVLLLVELATGLGLGLFYSPSADKAWRSLLYLNFQQPFGWYLRALHFWGSNFLVVVLILHLIQVFVLGSYKYPRELTWITGVLLLLLTLAMALSGEVLRFDQESYWDLVIGFTLAGRTPLVGPLLVHLLMGGPIIAGATLTRMFLMHVALLPAAIIGLTALHLLLAYRLGISEWPMPGRIVRRETYLANYRTILNRDGEPLIPNGLRKDLVFAAATVAVLLVTAAIMGPKGPNGPPDPSIIRTRPHPDFFFLWMEALMGLLPAGLDTLFALIVLPILIAGLIALPLISPSGERHMLRRPLSLVIATVVVTALFVTTWFGTYDPWSQQMDAWSGTSTPVEYVKGRTPLEIQGAILIQAKQCRNCHSLGGTGGMRGPALDTTATRLTRNELIRQILQGGGNMPAYGKALKPAEVAAIVAFLATMHPPNEPPARNSAQPATGPATGG
ncbi:MAG: cytochrome b N-terminal domain-containing protein [Deltaproteobacteria bacterium]|nr:cytochrome b N-terminal domain-containing protein [Deltaproteobacteria bacterium]